MGTVIKVDFAAKRDHQNSFSVDLYTHDMRCERFDICAPCARQAYQSVVGSTVFSGDGAEIRAIAIYANAVGLRENTQIPLLISHFKEPDQTAQQR